MVALGEMIGNIAHQWRQPLNAISVSASGMRLKKELNMLDDKEFYEITSNIVNNTNYLSQVIEDFRNYIKGEKRVEQFDINTPLSKALSIFNSSIYNHKLTIVEKLENGIVLENYLNELIQILVNILNNAKDVLKEIENDEDRIIEISTYQNKNKAYISIKDSGGGIKEEIIDRIFEPYFTTKEKTQGTGLGLYMAYQIVNESLEGEIVAENSSLIYNNKTYKGANFMISFDLNKKYKNIIDYEI